MERAVQAQLITFLKDNEVFSKFQSGFRKRHSSKTAIVYLTDQIVEHMDNQRMCGTVFIDLKKAFDLVDHKCLLHKLDHYGVRGNALTWFEDYITTRTQKVNYDGKLSSSLEVECGVPQGSILGPLCFIFYINDLPECVTDCNINMYADDTIIYFAAKSKTEIEITLQNDLNRVSDWMKENRLIVNHTKTKTMLIGSRPRLKNIQTFDILMGGKRIERVTKCDKNLGVILDQHLVWHEHVESTGKMVAKRLGILSRIRYCLTLDAANRVYNTMIQPIFDHADTSWGVLSEVCNNELQRLQNRAACIVLRRNRTENCLSSLNWLHLSTRRKIHRCVLVFKIFNCVPVYFNDYFTKKLKCS